MNQVYIEFLRRAQLIADEVKGLTFLGNSILAMETIFTSFEEACAVCKTLEDNLSRIRSIAGIGRGLAAPQIGSGERCFVTFVDNQFQYFINPNLVSSSSAKNWYRENCLSCGPICSDLERPSEIVLSFTDKEGKQREEKFEGFMARLLQHEYDHLDGIVNITKAKPEDLSIISSDPLQEKLRLKKGN
jgi:peptide deformylase